MSFHHFGPTLFSKAFMIKGINQMYVFKVGHFTVFIVLWTPATNSPLILQKTNFNFFVAF